METTLCICTFVICMPQQVKVYVCSMYVGTSSFNGLWSINQTQNFAKKLLIETEGSAGCELVISSIRCHLQNRLQPSESLICTWGQHFCCKNVPLARVTRSAKMLPNPFFYLKKLMHNILRGKNSPKVSATSVIFTKQPNGTRASISRKFVQSGHPACSSLHSLRALT
jgi:hypothetical protein